MKTLALLAILPLLGACASTPVEKTRLMGQPYPGSAYSHNECVDKCHEDHAVGTEFNPEAKPWQSCRCFYWVSPTQ